MACMYPPLHMTFASRSVQPNKGRVLKSARSPAATTPPTPTNKVTAIVTAKQMCTPIRMRTRMRGPMTHMVTAVVTRPATNKGTGMGTGIRMRMELFTRMPMAKVLKRQRSYEAVLVS